MAVLNNYEANKWYDRGFVYGSETQKAMPTIIDKSILDKQFVEDNLDKSDFLHSDDKLGEHLCVFGNPMKTEDDLNRSLKQICNASEYRIKAGDISETARLTELLPNGVGEIDAHSLE